MEGGSARVSRPLRSGEQAPQAQWLIARGGLAMSSEIRGYVAKSELILPDYGKGFDGSAGCDVDFPLCGRGRKSVRRGPTVEDAADNDQSKDLGA
jgi:hypothetical protein